MKARFYTLLFLFIPALSFGQKTEMMLTLESGLFSFRGHSAESTSFLNVYNRGSSYEGYTNNAFGSKSGISQGGSFQIQRINKRKLFAGIGIGFENLLSKIDLLDVYVSTPVTGGSTVIHTGANPNLPVIGHTYLSNRFVTLNPYIGFRFPTEFGVAIDFQAGFDAGYLLSARENGRAELSNGTVYTTSTDRKYISLDIRPRLQATLHYRKIGLFAGYSHGLVNYKEGWIGGINEAYSKYLRFGAQYRLR
ncbi:hypothetical protein [Arsenicibacter rosenii]|uniref:Outer membrane protein beta-barrel domain-containing protein n=1 Tax=Arsenicibacter rosenii TaxID=1750698 RepID=A0A1S2VIA6_9BACT|nr:hypothetical protein [Arsenicibacter rosenii]OIN58487.1 hypothetical protein BLX24_12990 [Arsenicibacter rosenii]